MPPTPRPRILSHVTKAKRVIKYLMVNITYYSHAVAFLNNDLHVVIEGSDKK